MNNIHQIIETIQNDPLSKFSSKDLANLSDSELDTKIQEFIDRARELLDSSEIYSQAITKRNSLKGRISHQKEDLQAVLKIIDKHRKFIKSARSIEKNGMMLTYKGRVYYSSNALRDPNFTRNLEDKENMPKGSSINSLIKKIEKECDSLEKEIHTIEKDISSKKEILDNFGELEDLTRLCHNESKRMVRLAKIALMKKGL